MKQYFFQGYWECRGSIISAVLLYIIILVFLWISNKRRKLVITKSIFELIFIIYCICVLRITGIIGMKFNLSYFSFSMLTLYIPFVDGSIKMIFLNFLLFVPYGFLLPIVFRECKWSYKKIIVIGFGTTIIIELLQVFAGRFSEIDDILTNGFGTLVGYIIYVSLGKIKDRYKRRSGIIQLITTCLIVAVVTFSISLVCKKDVVSIILDINDYRLYWGNEYDVYTKEGDSTSFKNNELQYKKQSKYIEPYTLYNI